MLKRQHEAPLNLPPDHPVRRLFQRFRQQREARLASERAADVEQGGVLLEPVLTGTPRTAPPRPPETSGQAPPAAEPPKARGWARLKGPVGAAQSCSSVSETESVDVFPDRTKSHQQASLKKADSCDSGITRSDLRLDHVGGARTPQEQSPVQSADKRVACPLPEQDLQASMAELRQDLRGHLGSLDRRMAALEARLPQLLQLLRSRRSSGSSSRASQASSPGVDKDSSP